ncbi:MAG: hypothetical protein LM583_05525 [Desulfurococcaceae archaeon]|jgi:hypothetical protein|nr:hypothetical protein [Desulfurococcaceae archaeon]
MALTLILDPISLLLLSSLFTAIVLVLVIVMFRAAGKKEERVTEDTIVMYIGGEHESILSLRFPSSDALYWAVLKRVFKGVYRYLVNAMHTGHTLDWLKYMSMWYGFLMVLAILITLFAIVYGWR